MDISVNNIQNRKFTFDKKVNKLFNKALNLKKDSLKQSEAETDIQVYEEAIAKYKKQQTEIDVLLQERNKAEDELKGIRTVQKLRSCVSNNKCSLAEEQKALKTAIKSYSRYFDTRITIKEASNDIFTAIVTFFKTSKENPTSVVEITINRKDRKITEINMPSITSDDERMIFKNEISDENGYNTALLLKKISGFK